MNRALIFFVVSFCLLFPIQSGFAGEMGWRYTGQGDCAGMDAGGLTFDSPTPDAERCTTAFKGMTAVCWDGNNLRHYGSDKPQCTYKNVHVKNCTGGGSPGYMYECTETVAYRWIQAGMGDCSGRDVKPLSFGLATPTAELCNAAFLNKTAVCWDGSSKKHWGSDKPQCTYKDVDANQCAGGGSPGYLYRCVQQ